VIGWSRCNFALKASFISGVALGPSITLAGSPGTACIIMNMVATALAMIKIANKILWIVYLIKWHSKVTHACSMKNCLRVRLTLRLRLSLEFFP
jgi:hypothetical protein